MKPREDQSRGKGIRSRTGKRRETQTAEKRTKDWEKNWQQAISPPVRQWRLVMAEPALPRQAGEDPKGCSLH